MSDQTATNLTYWLSGGSIVAGLSVDVWIGLAGITIAIATFAYNVYHKREMRKIAREQGVRVET